MTLRVYSTVHLLKQLKIIFPILLWLGQCLLTEDFVLAYGNCYPEWKPFLISDSGKDSNPCV
ncbi:hypothetical protein E2C01_021561 [Portunus trituberculatus]|uniref:Uncharacterized protein n=1 Tax=Portunus trituberculatus TaxID=210409 RepID=A0A5B7E319_PORTR|nr:hypothetical protein [Portunus trituberculatus]